MALQIAAAFLALSTLAHSARQDYDVHKIIEAFRRPRSDLTILCAHRGLRWNGTTENSHDAYFRASQAGIECIETDIHISLDGQLPMIHDKGLGRETDVGEFTGRAAYNPYTGQGYNPAVADLNFTGFIEHLHLRDEAGRVHEETVPTLPDMVQNIHKNGANVVLQLDFKDKEAVEPAYLALKNLTNAAGVPANEWCIYKLQAAWWQTPEELEAQAWMRDALENGVRIPYIPVYQPADEGAFDTLASLKAFMSTNYTISAEIELYSKDGPGQELVDWVSASQKKEECEYTFSTSGIFFADGDFTVPIFSPLTTSFYDTGNFSLPKDIRFNNSAYAFQDSSMPKLLDVLVGNKSADGRDHRSDFDWLLRQGFNWIITDNADLWHTDLEKQGKRNMLDLLQDGKTWKDGRKNGWYKRFFG
ncbi:hypothetical protein HBH77_087190 [Parastagonospora nodorum]|nr:hypothetical protein HBI78_117340 [Parastagonospora nodorum]KAH5107585.1 hypothetical protein HBH71_191970 [Parastagonospora nodorum]KAH5188336.1 hypothetical protein HBH76_102350 [Parastagonospora nodorum]KAH5208986.1 hypothetical protein HBH77_087190 [Parastagonospora nodorum]KAH5375381.1 hypothetical protein HBI33_164810 [Parastagonospora nodorum]